MSVMPVYDENHYWYYTTSFNGIEIYADNIVIDFESTPFDLSQYASINL